MILVTVGTHNQGFERLVWAADELAKNTQEEVVIQYGSSKYVPKQADSFRWASNQVMEQLISEARVVVTHAAAGSMIMALLYKKPMIVVPRSRIYRECIDDHQNQLAKVISLKGLAIYVKNPTPNSLKLAIGNCNKLATISNSNQQLIIYLKYQFKVWDQTDKPWIYKIFGKA